MGVESLWVGATNNSHYLEHTKTLKKQQFAKEDIVDGKEILFSVMLDKGYRASMESWKATGNATNICKEQRRFTGRETIYSASIALHHSVNERRVNSSKLCRYLRRGLCPNGNPCLLDNMWLLWGFMVNFLYKSVL